MLRVTQRTRSVRNGIPTRSMGTIGVLTSAYRSSRSNMGTIMFFARR